MESCGSHARSGGAEGSLLHTEPGTVLQAGPFPSFILLPVPSAKGIWQQLHPQLHVPSSAHTRGFALPRVCGF